MNDIDEIRSVLAEATRLPGEVRPRPEAASLIRGRAVRQRQRKLAAGAGALSAFVVAAALVVGTDGLRSRDEALPASSSTPTASESLEPSPTIFVAAGARTFTAPIEIHRVITGYPVAECPPKRKTVPTSDGVACYELAPTAIVLRGARDMQSTPATNAQGQASPGETVIMSMNEADRVAFSVFTKTIMMSERADMAFVVNDRVYFATQTEHITHGVVQFDFHYAANLRAFLTAVGVEFSEG